ncbi:NADP-specific glutamate dehydrogenase [Guggenheimella bovis]
MQYIQEVLEKVKTRNANEPEFIQTIEEVFGSLEPVLERHPEWVEANILERIAEPERQIIFRVPWVDDNGKIQVNRGFRVQFNGAIGPYKGGIRFAPNVYIGIMKFLGFEQIFKNALTGLPIGGGKGGADFDPTGKSDGEIMRFCQSFMTELYRHIGPDVDVPAGDLGVGGREVGYMYGQYRRIRGRFENGVITGKGLSYGGCATRPPATGWGIAYFAEEVMKHEGTDLKGKTVAVSGFGNVAWGACQKLAELGAKVVTLSGPDGYIYDPDGVSTKEKIDYMVEMRDSRRNKVQDYADKFGCQFFPGEKPWNVKVDIAMPCAMQNDVHLEHAKQLVANGVKYMIEGANMPCTNEAVTYMQENKMIVGPSKACNAGGVATSALEMSMNSMRYNWTDAEVDEKLHQIMIHIHESARAAAEENGFGYDLVKGANIAGFLRVAEAMAAQGDY